MAGNYEKSMYNQLMEVMARLDTVEKESRHEISRLNDEISVLKKENLHLREENQLLLTVQIWKAHPPSLQSSLFQLC